MIDQFLSQLMFTPSSDAQARLAHEAAPILVRTPGCADRLVAAVLKETQRRVAMLVLGECLDNARMAVENGQTGGAAFLAAVADRLAAAKKQAVLDRQLALALAGCYARAGLEVPAALQLPAGRSTPLIVSEHRRASGKPSGAEAAMDAAIEKLVRENDGTPLQLHAMLTELFAAVPPPVRSMMIHRICVREGTTYERLIIFWLLDPAAETRRAAAQALSDRARAGSWSPGLRHDVEQLVAWLPEGREREVLRAMLANSGAAEQPASRQDRATPKAARTSWRIEDVLVSMPDGAGCQNLTISAMRGRDHAVAVCLLKRKHGVKDAFVVPCRTKAERLQMIRRIGSEVPMLPVTADFARIVLGRALSDGIAAKALPAPGLLEVVELTGPLTPVPNTLATILASLSAQTRAMVATKAQVKQLTGRDSDILWQSELFDSWFEQTEALDRILAAAETEAAAKAAIWEQLEARRLWWAEQLALAAATADASPVLTPFARAGLAAAATRLLDKGTLKSVSVMKAVVAASLEAYLGREAEQFEAITGRSPRSAAGSAMPLSEALQVAGLSPAFLQGWGTALAAAPIPLSPQLIMETLLIRLVGVPVESIDALLANVSDALGEAAAIGADQAELRTCLRRHTPTESGQWCSGFSAMVASSKRCWPQKRLGSAGKSLLSVIAAGAPAGLSPDDRETVIRLLPQLIAQAD